MWDIVSRWCHTPRRDDLEYTTKLQRDFMKSAVSDVPDEVVFPQYRDLNGEVLRQTVLPRARDIDAFIAADAASGEWAKKLWPRIICVAYPELVGKCFKDLLIMMALKAVHNRVDGRANLDFVENFSGKGMVTCHLIQRGLVGKRHDVVYQHCREQDADFYNACSATGSR